MNTPATGLTTAEAAERLRRDGPNDVPEQVRHPLLLLARKFWGLSAWMIELIAGLSLVLGKYADLWVALALLVINALLSFFQEQRASAAVTALRRRLQINARVLRDGAWLALPAHDLVLGDVVRLRTGDFVPADVQLQDGDLVVDQSALTGESGDICKKADDTLYSGATVRQGEATAVVTGTGLRTYYGRTTQLVETAQPKLHVEELIARVVKWLLFVVGAGVAVTVAVSVAAGLSLVEILPLSLVLLMSAVPVALPAMLTVSMAVGAIGLARRGVLVTRLSAAEDAATMDVLCADKTGTLTMNRPTLAELLPQPGFTEQDVLRDGALASHAADQDPIDMAFLRAAGERHLLAAAGTVLAFTPFSAQTRRTEALVATDGRQVRVMKGALRTIAQAAGLAGPVLAALEARAADAARQGYRMLAVARAEGGGPPRMVGVALLHDAPRTDSRQLIGELQALGVSVKMLTGDALPIAREVAHELGLGEIVRAPDLRAAGSDAARLVRDSAGFAEVFPEDKHLVVQSLQAAGHVVGMTGDGVNDAPALRQAEVGIAVSGATDVAKGAASVVLTTEGLGGIIEMVKSGRAIYQRVLTWVINKISRTILKAGFVVIAFLVTGKFVVSALAMVLIVFMTDFVKLALSTDRARPSPQPESWNIVPLVRVAVAIGLLMLAEALALLAFGWRRFDLGAADGQLHTFAFQTLLFFALFSIVSIRERRAFWRSWPSLTLALALAADALVGILIGLRGLAELRPLPFGQTAMILAYTLICSLTVNDLVKTVWLARLGKTGVSPG